MHIELTDSQYKIVITALEARRDTQHWAYNQCVGVDSINHKNNARLTNDTIIHFEKVFNA